MGGPHVRGTAPDAGRCLYTDQAADRNRAVEATCWMLLKRYGIVFRDLLARETNLPKWRELQMAFRRLEDRGEIRGGRFVDGFLGEQFALPVAVESLRATRKMPLTGETIVLSAADPLNLVGILLPGERVPAISGRTVIFRDGVAVQEGCSGFATIDRDGRIATSGRRDRDFLKPVLGSQLGVLGGKNDRESDEGVPRIPDQRIPAETQKALPPSLFAGQRCPACSTSPAILKTRS